MCLRNFLSIGSRQCDSLGFQILPLRSCGKNCVISGRKPSQNIPLEIKTQNKSFKKHLGGVRRMLMRQLMKLYKEVENKINTYDQLICLKKKKKKVNTELSEGKQGMGQEEFNKGTMWKPN